MKRVAVSLPVDVLRAVDVEADRRGTSRSGLLRELAEESLRLRCLRRAERMTEIQESAQGAEGHGGNVAEVLKASRPRH